MKKKLIKSKSRTAVISLSAVIVLVLSTMAVFFAVNASKGAVSGSDTAKPMASSSDLTASSSDLVIGVKEDDEPDESLFKYSFVTTKSKGTSLSLKMELVSNGGENKTWIDMGDGVLKRATEIWNTRTTGTGPIRV